MRKLSDIPSRNCMYNGHQTVPPVCPLTVPMTRRDVFTSPAETSSQRLPSPSIRACGSMDSGSRHTRSVPASASSDQPSKNTACAPETSSKALSDARLKMRQSVTSRGEFKGTADFARTFLTASSR